MHQWIGSILVQIMDCHLFSARPLSEPVQCYSQLDPRERTWWNSNQSTKLFIHENTSENIICEIVAIFVSRGIWVNYWKKMLFIKLETTYRVDIIYMHTPGYSSIVTSATVIIMGLFRNYYHLCGIWILIVIIMWPSLYSLHNILHWHTRILQAANIICV